MNHKLQLTEIMIDCIFFHFRISVADGKAEKAQLLNVWKPLCPIDLIAFSDI